MNRGRAADTPVGSLTGSRAWRGSDVTGLAGASRGRPQASFRPRPRWTVGWCRRVCQWLRFGWRAGQLAFLVTGSLVDLLFGVGLAAAKEREPRRRLWLHRWSRRAVRALNMEVSVTGDVPRTGVIVANHPSFLDFLVLASRQPVVFVARPEIRNWGGIGWLARAAGTVFLDHLPGGPPDRFAAEVGSLVTSGARVVLFPEGCRSGGAQVLPFLSALLAPAAAAGWPVTPARIDFPTTPSMEVRRTRQPTLAAHVAADLLPWLKAGRSEVTVAYGATRDAGSDRRCLARGLREEILGLEVRKEESASGRQRLDRAIPPFTAEVHLVRAAGGAA